MERKNIAFQYGIHRSPSSGNDGELSECINMEVHNGELTPSVMPGIAFTLKDGDKLLFVHKSGSYKNYIIQRGTDLCWFPDEDKTDVSIIGELTPKSIHSVGNTLVVLSENSMEYILFKSGNYKRIGSKPPFCSISFGLNGIYEVRFGSFTVEGSASEGLIDTSGFITGLETYFKDGTIPQDVSFQYLKDRIETDGYYIPPIYTQYVNKMTECGMGLINNLISDNTKLGRFTNSFYVRYAYRMYDGSHYMHSAPVLMPVSTFGPVLSPTNIELVERDHKIGMELIMPSASLDFKIVGFYDEKGDEVDSESIVDWEDIVKGVDIFVSKPVYTHKQDGFVWGYTGGTDEMLTSLAFTGKNNVYNPDNIDNILIGIYKNNTYSDLYINRDIIFTVEKDDDYLSKIEDTSLFYKVSEINSASYLSISSKYTMRIAVDIKDGLLAILEQQESLEDDYDSHNDIIPSFAHVYNGRLNVAGIRTKLFSGFPMESMVPYTYVPDSTNYTWSSKVKLDIEGREIEVVSVSNIKLYEKPAFIYYPNTKVKEFSLYMYDASSTPISSFSATFASKVHKLLNGSYYLSPSFGINDSYTLDLSAAGPIPSGDPYISYPNKIYTSEVNNPFFFPLSGRNSIGTGEIIAVTSNTKAISPGQFGQYPLIIFSSDGVWAMQTGEDGLYYSVHPISKDICINPNVLQTDGPVLFATANGLHSLIADNVQNISLLVKGRPESINYPSLDNDFNLMISNAANDSMTFNEFIKEAMFSYDYTNSRVIIYRKDKNYLYVYSMDSGMYSKMVIVNGSSVVNLQTSINAYPEVLMQAGSDIYTFTPDTDNTNIVYKGIMATRPLVFSDPLARKVMNDVRIIHHKVRRDTRCRYAMMVSDDGYNWIQRSSLRGHSFKYFRFVIFAELSDIEALVGMSIMYDYRRTNKFR